MKPVGLGIVGCGVIAQFHLRSAKQSPMVHVAAVADVLEPAVRETAKKFDVPGVYTDAERLLDDPAVEAVILALPAQMRTELALKAFKRGKHVLTEKPVAMNAKEVRRMIRARGNLTAGCCSARHRMVPSAKAAADVVASGALGALRTIHCRCLRPAGAPPKSPPPAWRLSKAFNGGGILVNWGCYDLDYLLGIAGWSLKPRVVLAQCWGVPPPFESHVAPGSDAETHFAAMILCEGGATITFERGEYMCAGEENAWQMIGDRGSLRLQMVRLNEKKVIHQWQGSPEHGATQRTLWEGQEADDPETIGQRMQEDFATAIREGRQPATSLEHALVMQTITDAIYESAARGKPVMVGQKEEKA